MQTRKQITEQRQITPNVVGEEEAGDVHANRNDHGEGELINIV